MSEGPRIRYALGPQQPVQALEHAIQAEIMMIRIVWIGKQARVRGLAIAAKVTPFGRLLP